MIDDGTSRNPLVRLIRRRRRATDVPRCPVTLEFDLRLGVVASSYVDIEQRSATSQVLEIAGLIDNPIGLTRLVNLNGPITATGTGRGSSRTCSTPTPRARRNGSIGSAPAAWPSTSCATAPSRR